MRHTRDSYSDNSDFFLIPYKFPHSTTLEYCLYAGLCYFHFQTINSWKHKIIRILRANTKILHLPSICYLSQALLILCDFQVSFIQSYKIYFENWPIVHILSHALAETNKKKSENKRYDALKEEFQLNHFSCFFNSWLKPLENKITSL